MASRWGKWARAAVAAGAVVIVGGACSTPQPPADYGRYVAAGTGVDTGTCEASASPCATINYAVSQATAGETIHVAAGTYPELVNVDKAMVFEGPNAIRAAGVTPGVRKPEAIVKGFRSPDGPGSAHPGSASQFNVTVKGFTINPQGDTTLITPSTHHLVSLFGGTNVVVSNNIFDGGTYVPDCDYNCTTMPDAALMVQSGNYQVANNTFTNFRSPMDVTQFDPTKPITSAQITGNAFTHYTNRAIWVQEATWANGGAFPHTVSIDNNRFDATGFADPSGPAGIVMTSGGNMVANNTFVANSAAVFVMVCDGSGANAAGVANDFTHNLFTSNGSGVQHYVVSAAQCGANPGVATITNNRFEGDYTPPSGPARPQTGVYWNGDVGVNGATAPNVLVAECNWWGVASGPELKGSPVVPGANAITLNVDATPWNVTPTGNCTGS